MLKKNTIIFLFSTLLFFGNNVSAQTNNSYWLNNRWNAQWIAPAGASLTNYGVYHFRKTFTLTKKPANFIVHVSGDNRYQLFVNGTQVCAGPSRGDTRHWNYETIDIAKYLAEGGNVIAAVVWNYGVYKPLAQMTNQTGFIIQGNTAAEEIVNTGNKWKVVSDDAYSALPMRPYHLTTGPGDKIEGAKYPYGWETYSYNDNAWSTPVLLGKGTPEGKFGESGWFLVPRTIPFMESRLQRLKEIKRTDNIIVPTDFLQGNKSFMIPANITARILVDQTFLTTAYPQLVVSKGKGSVIKINYAEALVDKNGTKGNRNDIQNKKMPNGAFDVFEPDGGTNRLFNTLWFRTYRYVEINIITQNEPLVLNDFYGIFTAYPFQQKATFNSDDSSLKDIWNVGWQTARLCANETYFDCPYYEQLQYIGDTRIQALISLYVAGDDRLMRQAIEQLHNSQLPTGLTQSRFPSNSEQTIPPFSLYWIAMIHDYEMYKNDKQFTAKYLDGIKGVLNWYKKHIDKTGMLGSMDWWNFVDWSYGPWDNDKPLGGTPPGAIHGNSAVITLQYAYALQMAAVIFKNQGDLTQARRYQNQSMQLNAAVYKNCWSKERVLLSDTPDKLVFSQHVNTMAVLTGVFANDQQKAVMNKVLNDKSLIKCTYYYQFYITRALKKANMANAYLSTLNGWKDMLKLGLTTFAETPEPTRSDCHAWSASPCYDLLAVVCGIESAQPGFKTVNISPALGTLNKIEGSMPHPNGVIAVSLHHAGKNGISGWVTLPKNVIGTFLWKSVRLKLKSGTQKISL
jgi:alpha-L-rhamnosidase